MTETEEQSSVTEEEQETKKEYDSDNDGDLFLYQMSAAFEGDKEVISKINFRRKHPQLGKKLSNHEIRIRKMEKTIAGLKKYLKTYIQEGMLKEIKDQFYIIRENLVDDL